ncbi:5-formyltetrahydrofolate cyclo-ligase [Brevundimonas sp. VNH65]|uniref:5-formyltetrahydrofolate cyclo-ligase n=1 Tax=Brevundimonas sp. VNH65 TaxID=3400917 RepID=UPI003C10291A
MAYEHRPVLAMRQMMEFPDKAALRADARARRKALTLASPDAARCAAAHAADLPPADVVAVYRAMGSELDPEPLALALAASGRRLCLPVVLKRDAPMIFRVWSPGEPLEMDVAGCPAPLPLAQTIDPDLVVTPLLAFDGAGGRLGQGGGYYDRTFAVRPDVTRIGLAFAGQQVEHLPIEAHDIRLHGVLTETGYRSSGISR